MTSSFQNREIAHVPTPGMPTVESGKRPGTRTAMATASLENLEVVTQDTVERILGRLLTDAHFRQRFFAERHDRLRRFDLLEHERESLAKLDTAPIPSLVAMLAERLDPRIVRG